MTPWLHRQLDRFDLWAAHNGIIAWHLRERPELVDMILQLLALLHDYLSAICTLADPIAGRATAAVEDASLQNQPPSPHASSSISSSECSFGQAPETSSVVADPIDTMRERVEQVLSELFRVSATIHSAEMIYRYTKVAKFVEKVKRGMMTLLATCWIASSNYWPKIGTTKPLSGNPRSVIQMMNQIWKQGKRETKNFFK
ncbi:hypothetical protein T069G_01892 [Trichoderma breve]|uniref:Uncharacterized protein n=1 Tax=Trichoderma breve TaxID=2034170 RepID=A0A9W9EEK0_9HYPO|nr:hypothetical protein T069G_01892 [Trichoderma breve]KAJ4865362.1 hypothetical protein T069G_01892 [Trichoderma breve]